MSSSFTGVGAALENAAVDVMRIGEALGPITVVVNNLGENPIIVSAVRDSDGTNVPFLTDTAVAAEDIGYNGNTILTDFTGNLLTNTLIAPGSLLVVPTAGGASVNARDFYGNGLIYTDDNDRDLCGSINYSTKAVDLSFPAGKEPNTGSILFDYIYQATSTVQLGKLALTLGSNPPSENYTIRAAAIGGNSKVRIEGNITF